MNSAYTGNMHEFDGELLEFRNTFIGRLNVDYKRK